MQQEPGSQKRVLRYPIPETIVKLEVEKRHTYPAYIFHRSEIAIVTIYLYFYVQVKFRF